MYIPGSTYRLQANSNFKFHQIKDIISYLDQLGVTTIYCAPLFQSKPGSNHGYDVVNPHAINTELGSLEELRYLTWILGNRKMGWLQDIVPNHMAYDHTNVWLRDIFEKGIHSDFWQFFDIDWLYEEEQLKGKVLMPFLATNLNETLDKGEIQLHYSQQGFSITYNEADYPLIWSSYYSILSYAEKSGETNEAAQQSFNSVIDEFKTIRSEFSDAMIANETPQLKERLYELYLSEENIKSIIDTLVSKINTDASALENILNDQQFAMVPYHATDQKINYRRFFIVNELICLRMERPEVFNHYHQFLKALLDEGLIQGLRVDHIDGLADPASYLSSLRELTGEGHYLIVEKILEAEESMPSHWPIQGTSGYEFLKDVNHLFTKQENEEKLTGLYHQFIGVEKKYNELTFEKKHFILTTKMNGELENLLALFVDVDSTASNHQHLLKEALAVFLSCFSVYRTYVNGLPLSEKDQEMIDEAFKHAASRRPDLMPQLQFMQSLLSIEPSDRDKDKKLKLLIRLQQFTGPLAAKGVEDTVFYVYNRLISHNEVGDCPKRFGMSVDAFHDHMKQRLEKLPLSINATSTHDTKRGEDARMRINVLSEIPDAWKDAVLKWKDINKRYKQHIEGIESPDANDEYFIYQSLIGGFPADEKWDDVFLQRFKDFMTKSVREARTNSDWTKPNALYEQHTLSFVEAILKDEEFMNTFLSFFKKVKHYGMVLSLGQTLVKITAPGIPDTFQGAELWDLNFVDPDNRQTVDFNLRKNYLANIVVYTSHGDKQVYLNQLMDQASDGRIKLYTIWTALNERRKNLPLFQHGAYIPLAFEGAKRNCLVGYARKSAGQWFVTIAPKEVSVIGAGMDFPLGDIWEDTAILLPADAPNGWKNAFTGEEFYSNHEASHASAPDETSAENKLLLSQVLKAFPIALLKN